MTIADLRTDASAVEGGTQHVVDDTSSSSPEDLTDTLNIGNSDTRDGTNVDGTNIETFDANFDAAFEANFDEANFHTNADIYFDAGVNASVDTNADTNADANANANADANADAQVSLKDNIEEGMEDNHKGTEPKVDTSHHMHSLQLEMGNDDVCSGQSNEIGKTTNGRPRSDPDTKRTDATIEKDSKLDKKEENEKVSSVAQLSLSSTGNDLLKGRRNDTTKSATMSEIEGRYDGSKISSTNDIEDYGKGNRRVENYPPDCYSFLSLHGPFDAPMFFGMGIVVVFFQFALILLMVLSVLHPDWSITGDADNARAMYNKIAAIVAANASPIVRATQIFALLSYVLFAEASVLDITTGVETFPRFSKVARGDKVGCMIFSCTLRIMQGIMAIVAALLLIITADSAVEIVLNFTAINFIGHLDNVAFRLAVWGKYGPKLEDEAKRIAQLQLPYCMTQRNKHVRFQCTLAVLGFILLSFISAIWYAQEDDNIWRTKVMRVEFQDESLQFFSGCYDYDKNATDIGNSYKRDVFTSNGTIESASFRYCIDERRWILSRERDFGCDPKAKEYELAHSMKTDSFDILTAFDEGWFSASGTPLDLYVVELASKFQEQCLLLDNGECNADFNSLAFQYDGGDCCAATCSHPNCGTTTLNSAFGSAITAYGFPNCTDPSMIPITILIDNYWKITDMMAEAPYLMVKCDGKIVLSLIVNQDMVNGTHTVHVNEGADCIIRVKQESGAEFFQNIWYVNYTIFNGDSANDDRKIIKGTSSPGGKAIEAFRTMPACMLDTLSKRNVSIFETYNDVYGKQALYWMAGDTTGNSDCKDNFFIERYALSEFSFSAPSYIGNQPMWVNTNPTCLWFVTECKNDSVSEVNLEFHKLKGVIPTSIGLLSSVSKLDLGNNMLHGTIPSEIGTLTRLEYMLMGANSFSGRLPSEIGHLTRLKYVDLSMNNPGINGTIPSEIGKLIDLEKFTAYATFSLYKLSGILPSELGHLSRLQLLILDDNKLSGSIPRQIGNLSSLSGLQLAFNRLEGTLPSEIGNLSSLQTVTLGDNKLNGTIPSEIGRLTNVRILSMTSNIFTGSIPSNIGSLTGLESLDLSNCLLTGPIPTEILLLTALTSLRLDGNALTGSIPSEIGNLLRLTKLSLDSNNFAGPIPTEIGRLSSLVHFSSDNNELNGTIPSEIGRLSSLSKLSLTNNTLSGSIPKAIANLSSLGEMDLSLNSLTGSIPREFWSLSSMWKVLLNDNFLIGNIPSDIGHVPSDIGSITTDIELLSKKMQQINVNNNALTGSIPSEVSNLSRLYELSMNNNKLTGSIPSEIGLMPSLKELDIGNNGLTGTIPSELGKLEFVQCFTLEPNNFTFINTTLITLCDGGDDDDDGDDDGDDDDFLSSDSSTDDFLSSDSSTDDFFPSNSSTDDFFSSDSSTDDFFSSDSSTDDFFSSDSSTDDFFS